MDTFITVSDQASTGWRSCSGAACSDDDRSFARARIRIGFHVGAVAAIASRFAVPGGWAR